VTRSPADTDPFRALGLERRASLADDDVRAAWRRVAAATHPDRTDGGDPPAFATAAAAYTVLRTPAGRREVLADLLAVQPPGPVPARPAGGSWSRLAGLPPRVLLLAIRIRRGRPAMLALRVLAAIATSVTAIAAAGWQPATPAVIAGALTWLILTGRGDLAGPPSPARPRLDPAVRMHHYLHQRAATDVPIPKGRRAPDPSRRHHRGGA
jgi:DnaJ domain